MFFSQYGRYMAYIECTLASASSTDCDCEKQLPSPTDLPPARNTSTSFEEYYLPAIPWRLMDPPEAPRAEWTATAGRYTFSPYADIFRPPRA